MPEDQTGTSAPALPVKPKLTDQQLSARGLGIQAAFGSRFFVLASDVPALKESAYGRQILASATAFNDQTVTVATDNPTLVPGEDATHGFTGLNVQMGRIREEYNRDLSDIRSRMTIFDEMRRSETAVASSEMLICQPIAQTEYYIIPGDDKELAGKLEWNLFESLMQPKGDIPGRPFSRVAREAALSVFMGCALHYQKYGVLDSGSGGSFNGWTELAPRMQKTIYQWDMDDEGHVLGVVLYGVNPRTMRPAYVYYRRDEIVQWSWIDDGGDPEGLGSLRRAYRAYKQKDEFQSFAAVRIERQACGIPVAIAPEGEALNTVQANAVLSMMVKIRSGAEAGGMLPYGWEVKMLDLGDATVPFEGHIERQHQSILQTTGAQMVGFGQGGDPGSNALITGASAWFGEVLLEAIADWLCDTFTCEAIPDWCKRNGYTGKKYPQLGHGKVAIRNLEQYTRAIERYTRDNGGPGPDVHTTWKDVMGITPDTQGKGGPPVQPPVDSQLPAGETGGKVDSAPSALDDSGRTPAATSSGFRSMGAGDGEV
jgi:hypothetical protein